MLGDKDIAIRPTRDGSGGGTTEEVPVDPQLLDTFCLGQTELAALDRLASDCDRVYGSTAHDIEFAFRGGELFLLQRRPITRA
jgi:pyruvate, water dikinase